MQFRFQRQINNKYFIIFCLLVLFQAVGTNIDFTNIYLCSIWWIWLNSVHQNSLIWTILSYSLFYLWPLMIKLKVPCIHRHIYIYKFRKLFPKSEGSLYCSLHILLKQNCSISTSFTWSFPTWSKSFAKWIILEVNIRCQYFTYYLAKEYQGKELLWKKKKRILVCFFQML